LLSEVTNDSASSDINHYYNSNHQAFYYNEIDKIQGINCDFIHHKTTTLESFDEERINSMPDRITVID
jgi:hypothetical protein